MLICISFHHFPRHRLRRCTYSTTGMDVCRFGSGVCCSGDTYSVYGVVTLEHMCVGLVLCLLQWLHKFGVWCGTLGFYVRYSMFAVSVECTDILSAVPVMAGRDFVSGAWDKTKCSGLQLFKKRTC